MRFLIVIAFIIYSAGTSAQDTLHIYLDSSATIQTSKENGVYHFMIYKNDSVWCVDKILTSGNFLFEKSHYADIKLTTMHGPYLSYSALGMISEKGNFSNGERNGLWLNYDNTGYLKDSFYYAAGELYEKYKYFNGKLTMSEKFTRAERSVTIYHDNGNIKNRTVFGDNLRIISEEEFSTEGKPLTEEEKQEEERKRYRILDSIKRKGSPLKFPEYPSGQYGLQRFIDTEIKLPMRQRYIHFFPCEFGALISFNRKGNIDSIKVIKSVNVDFDNIVVTALKRMPNWNMKGTKTYNYALFITFVDDRTENDKPRDIIPNQQKRNF
jgi:antitoxin component YwqK of YwqJK toxin-antitoxin module